MSSTVTRRQPLTQPLTPFQQHALALSAQQHIDESLATLLSGLRQDGVQQFERATWPGRKVEQWKYTSVQALQTFDTANWATAAQVSGEFITQRLIPVDGTRLVFVDGQLDVAASDSMPDGVCLFSQAGDGAANLIAEHLGKVAGSVDAARRNLFAALNSAWTADGLFVHVARNVVLAKPLYLVHVSSTQQPNICNYRSLVVMEQGASAQIIEHFLSDTNDSDTNDSDTNVSDTKDPGALVNTLTEIELGQNARLHHTRLNLEHESIAHIGAVHINLGRDAACHAFTVAEGSALKRLDYQFNYCGQGASLNFDGVYLARHNQQVDYHTCIEHRVPNCTSQQVFRGIVGDKARAVFNGRIHIAEDAQKTLAEMNNRNLLTSNIAEINTKPELEIYADDVKCAHGATISQLDETALYYLQSRGISPANARMMLSFGFINELLSSAADETVQSWLENWLRGRFSEDRSLVSELKSSSDAGARN